MDDKKNVLCDSFAVLYWSLPRHHGPHCATNCSHQESNHVDIAPLQASEGEIDHRCNSDRIFLEKFHSYAGTNYTGNSIIFGRLCKSAAITTLSQIEKTREKSSLRVDRWSVKTEKKLKCFLLSVHFDQRIWQLGIPLLLVLHTERGGEKLPKHLTLHRRQSNFVCGHPQVKLIFVHPPVRLVLSAFVFCSLTQTWQSTKKFLLVEFASMTNEIFSLLKKTFLIKHTGQNRWNGIVLRFFFASCRRFLLEQWWWWSWGVELRVNF